MLAAVADENFSAASALAAPFGANVFPSFTAMRSQTELDAIIVASTPEAREETILESLESNLPVLCEMPLTLDSDSAARIAVTARSTGTLVSVAAPLRLVDDVRFARELIASELLGAIQLCEIVLAPRGESFSGPSVANMSHSGGVLPELGAPCIDLMSYFLGPLAELQAFEGPRRQGQTAAESVRLFVRSATGVAGEADLSLAIAKEAPYYASLYGAHGALLLGWNVAKYRVGSDRWIAFGHGYRKLAAHRQMLDQFAAAVRGLDVPAVSLDEALATVDAVSTACAALATNRWHSLARPVSAEAISGPLINIG